MLYESIRGFQYAETAAQVIIVVVTVVGSLPRGFYCRGPREAL
jgi:ABC-type phosphate/phosphonate transport system permease subunit